MNQNSSTDETVHTVKEEALQESIFKACAKIAPLWPLESFVAVNPYLGLSDLSFDEAAIHLAWVGGIKGTLPLSYYLDAYASGIVEMQDIQEALHRKSTLYGEDIESFIKDISGKQSEVTTEATVAALADVASIVYAKDWTGFMVDRISVWAAAYFDRGQAQWKSVLETNGIYAAWRFEGETDITTEVMGMKGFRRAIKGLPAEAMSAAAAALQAMQISEKELDLYLHRLLLRHGGWAAYIAHIDWDLRRYGRQALSLSEFLCILISWEYGIYSTLQLPLLAKAWKDAKRRMRNLTMNAQKDKDLWNRLVLQEAYDIAAQRRLIEKFDAQASSVHNQDEAPTYQAVFCIDVRSELYRRNLEMVSKEVDTMGFAGFFGFPIKFLPLGHEATEDHCPVLLPAVHTVSEGFKEMSQHKAALSKRRSSRQLSHAWKAFRSGAVASFGFVSPIGLSYLPKLFTDSFGITRPVPHPDRKGLGNNLQHAREMEFEPGREGTRTVGIPFEIRVQMAKGALTAMSLTDGFARLVLMIGHGASSVNNPHAAGLDCGACAGHSGEANARVAAEVLNDPAVRAALRQDNINIPLSTHFMAALHDTTTDEVALYNLKAVPASHAGEVERLQLILAKAGKAARAERAIRLGIDRHSNTDDAVKSRCNDWSQVRPEWGLAGCSAFIAAPRTLSKGIDLQGRSFLHSYEWKKDRGFKVLEVIMTAPMIVASWINLQYYGSTVDNKHLGSGNKTLHNVTAGLGVLEGYAGDLRPGLPLQSIHDGSKHQHEPLRLSVVINAPKEAINEVLDKHPLVKALCDNGWIFLMVLDDSGKVSYRYRKNQKWDSVIAASSSEKPETKAAMASMEGVSH